MELQEDATASVGNMDQAGTGEVIHLDLSDLCLQAAVRGKQVTVKNVQSENNVADLGTMALAKDTIDRHMEKLRCVRADQQSLMTHGRRGVCCERTPQNDCATSTLRRDQLCHFHSMISPSDQRFRAVCVNWLGERATMSTRDIHHSEFEETFATQSF